MKEDKDLITFESFQSWHSKKVPIRFVRNEIKEALIVEVTPLTEADHKRRMSFSSILLTEMKDRYYSQGTYLVTLPDGREEMLFMVPIGIDTETGGIRYEVIFN